MTSKFKKLYSTEDAVNLAPNKSNVKSVFANFSALIDNGGKFNSELESIARNHACRLIRRMKANEFAPATDTGLENSNAVLAAQNVLHKLTADTFEEQNGFEVDFFIIF